MLTSTDFSGLFNQRFARNFIPVPAVNRLQLGQPTPDFQLLDISTQKMVKLSNYREKKPIILAFTRIFTEKQYCPFCYPHIKALKENYDRFLETGCELLLITSTDNRQSQIVQQDLGLKMPLLSNPHCDIFRLYGTGQALGAPLPAQFILDKMGNLRYKHLFSFLSHNASVDTLLNKLSDL